MPIKRAGSSPVFGTKMQVWCSGNMLAFQADVAGSNPATCLYIHRQMSLQSGGFVVAYLSALLIGIANQRRHWHEAIPLLARVKLNLIESMRELTLSLPVGSDRHDVFLAVVSTSTSNDRRFSKISWIHGRSLPWRPFSFNRFQRTWR